MICIRQAIKGAVVNCNKGRSNNIVMYKVEKKAECWTSGPKTGKTRGEYQLGSLTRPRPQRDQQTDGLPKFQNKRTMSGSPEALYLSTVIHQELASQVTSCYTKLPIVCLLLELLAVHLHMHQLVHLLESRMWRQQWCHLCGLAAPLASLAAARPAQ